MRKYLKWGVVGAVLLGVLWLALQYASWQRDRQEAATVARAVKYAVEQFSPAYLDFVRKNRRGPRDNLELALPPPRDSLWTGLSRAELYPNGDIHFEFEALEPDRHPLLVWHIDAREDAMTGLRVCGARDIKTQVLEWNGLNCDAEVAVPSADAPLPKLEALLPPRSVSPVDEVLDVVRQDNAESLTAMVAAGRDVCAVSTENITPLGEAVRGSQLKAIAVLVKTCDVNQIEPFSGRTPLMIAAAAREVELVRILLLAGASPATQTEKDDSAWFLLGTGSDDGSQQIREMLQVKGVDVDARAADQTTLLMRAAAVGNAKLVGWLLVMGAKADLQDQTGRSALMHAVLSPGGESALKPLIARKAQIDLADAEGRTAMTLAADISDLQRRKRVLDVLKGRAGKSELFRQPISSSSGRSRKGTYSNEDQSDDY